MKKIPFLILLSFFCNGIAIGNGISLSNLTSVCGAGFVQLQFDLTWNNSWNNSINHDAAWLFFKFKDNDGTWRHLELTGANNSVASGYTIAVPPDNTGAMISRSTTGLGTVSLTGIRLGVMNLPGTFDIKGFALEMVEIRLTDTFYLGDSSFRAFQNGPASGPFQVNSNTIIMGTATGNLNGAFDAVAGTNGTLFAGFPIGFSTQPGARVYMMKHELSQAGYRDFLNTLTYSQQVSRTSVAPNSAVGTLALPAFSTGRLGLIQIAVTGTSNSVPAVYGCNLNNNTVFNEADDGEWIGCGFLSWMDMAAFLDWAALRPMTELEFEKACRGPVFPVINEYAPGVSIQAASNYPISNQGTANEAATYAGSVLRANINTGNTAQSGPLRVGIHATSNSTRISSGAGYYGCLDLSGNISEYAVGIHNSAGRSFTGKNGDGALTNAGDANEDFWPGINGNNSTTFNTAFGGTTGVTGSAGYTLRGGSATNADYRVSARFNPGNASTRFQAQGGRGVKSW